jgi:hypothetical protein
MNTFSNKDSDFIMIPYFHRLPQVTHLPLHLAPLPNFLDMLYVIGTCYGFECLCLPQIHRFKPIIPKVMVLGSGPSKRLGHEGGTFVNRISNFINDA